MSETISRLIDRDLPEDQRFDALAKLGQSEETTRVWQQYHLIGNVMRGEVDRTGVDLSARIAAELDREPTVLAPTSFKRQAENSSTSVSESDVTGNKVESIWKSAGLMAIAASVALVAVTTIEPVTIPQNNANQLSIASLTLTNNDKENAVAAETATATASAARDRELFQQELGEMLAEHGEFSASAGLNGLIAYSKLVSAETIGE